MISSRNGAVPEVYTCGLTSKAARLLKNAIYEVE